jgi:DNA-binding GntR family transcriptional regulator
MQQAVEAGDMAAYVASDKLFDIAVAEAAGNCHLVRAAFPLQTHARRFWMQFHGTNGVERSLQRHLNLADAIMAQDVARSVREARKLLSYVQAEASRALETEDSDA